MLDKGLWQKRQVSDPGPLEDRESQILDLWRTEHILLPLPGARLGCLQLRPLQEPANWVSCSDLSVMSATNHVPQSELSRIKWGVVVSLPSQNNMQIRERLEILSEEVWAINLRYHRFLAWPAV